MIDQLVYRFTASHIKAIPASQSGTRSLTRAAIPVEAVTRDWLTTSNKLDSLETRHHTKMDK